MIFKLQLVFLQIMWLEHVVPPVLITSSCNCSVVIATEAGRQECRNIFSIRQVYKTAGSSVPSSALLRARNLLNTGICSTQKLLWIPLFHVHGSCTPSFWVTGMTCFGSVDVTNQRLYQGLVYWNRPFKEMITGSVTFSLLQCSPTFFRVSAFSIQWTWLSRSLEQATSWLNWQMTNNITTQLTYQGNNQSLIPKTDVIPLTLTLKVTTALAEEQGMAQWWERSPPINVARVQILASTPYVGWVCRWFSPLLQEVFVRVLGCSPPLKNQHFQIPIRSGIR